jgi:hypothetical protein
MHYQLPIHYDIGTNILTSLHQNNATHISNHIHEWHRRCRMIENRVLDKILMEWFTNSLLPPISMDVAIPRVATKE